MKALSLIFSCERVGCFSLLQSQRGNETTRLDPYYHSGGFSTCGFARMESGEPRELRIGTENRQGTLSKQPVETFYETFGAQGRAGGGGDAAESILNRISFEQLLKNRGDFFIMPYIIIGLEKISSRERIENEGGGDFFGGT
jgi:hypothetical protein